MKLSLKNTIINWVLTLGLTGVVFYSKAHHETELTSLAMMGLLFVMISSVREIGYVAGYNKGVEDTKAEAEKEEVTQA